MKESRFSIHSIEWLLSSSLFLVLISLFVIAKIQSSRFDLSPLQEPAQVSVEIRGEVLNPGIHLVAQGTQLGEVLRKSKPHQEVDLSAFDMNAPILESVKLELVKRSEMIVYVEGDGVDAAELKIPVGTRLNELGPLLRLKDRADRKALKRKRVLKHQETVVIPLKE